MIHLFHILSVLPDPKKGSVPIVSEFQSQLSDGCITAVTNSKEVVWFTPEYPNVRSAFREIGCPELYAEVVESLIHNFPEAVRPMTVEAIKESIVKIDPLGSRVIVRPKFRKRLIDGDVRGLNLTWCSWMSQIETRDNVAIVIPGEKHMAEVGFVKIIGKYTSFVAHGCFTKMVVHAS